ncbi:MULTISPECIES: pilus assembly protein N-terminal domain-containing protein [Bradyrhizobium]|uniref:pilus assembly protein N-terminal domain-containing protein n=1 Tax=Bradyrhizobium pachyrhizi TaxID=280333 RepID=UPI0004851EBA
MLFRFLCLSAGLVLMAHSVSAQDDRLREINISPEDTIKLQPGETRVFEFEQPVKQILTPGGENTVVMSPQTDRTFSIRGGEPGQTVVTALASDGRVIRRVRIVVGGHLVRIYGADQDSAFVPLICDEFRCDPLPSKDPIPKSVTVRTPMRGGGFVEKTY